MREPDDAPAVATGQAAPADVLDAMGVGVLVLDPTGAIEFANQHVTLLLGWTAAQLLGADIDEMLHPHSHRALPPTEPCSLVGGPGSPARRADDSDVFLRADGSLLPVAWTARPIDPAPGSDADAAARTVVTFADIVEQTVQSVADAASREQQRAELWTMQQEVSDLGWIAELTRVMSSTLDEAEALRRLARLLTPRLADVVLVDMIDDDGRWHRMGGSVADGVPLDLPSLLAAAEVQFRADDHETRAVASTQAVTRLDAAQMADPSVISPPSRHLLDAIGARTMLVTPLAARSRTVGVAGLIRLTDDAYTDDDLVLAADIGRRAGLVLDNARLYHRQQRTAEALQRALLPSVGDTDHLQVAADYRPAADRLRVGGDWYDLFRCANSTDAHLLVVGDVAGHDLPAATTMAALRNLLRGVAVTSADGPADVLAVVDAAMTTLAIGGTATVLVIRAERSGAEWTLTWANAGHLPALLIEPGMEQAELLTARVDPLLGTRTDPRRHEHTRVVPAGTRLVLYTDGLVERRDEDLDRGLQRLRHAAGGEYADVGEQLASLLDRIPRSASDDTAVLVAQLN